MTAHALDFADDHIPTPEMNTTPLIDVMLVLLIMFIVTIPIQTHAVKIEVGGPPPVVIVDPLKNKVVINARGGLFWNGAPTTLAGLADDVVQAQRTAPNAELHIQPVSEAPYARVDEVLATAKRAGAEKLGFVGNEQFREF